jgi:DNA (cytosine-5)-methyltransferase 1
MIFESGPALRAARAALGLSQAKLAELTGVPQHALSAYELEKAAPDPVVLRSVSETLSNLGMVKGVVTRKKRYQAHIYEKIKHDPSRILRHAKTLGNDEYVRFISELDENRKFKKHSALSLFSGCGGLSLGFTWAGYDIKGFVELEEELRNIYRSNFPEAKELGGDISSLSDKTIALAATEIGAVDVIIGGPPCQGFSLSGKRSVHDPRNTLFLDYLRFVDAFRPKVAVLENVRLLTSMKSPHGGYVRDEIQKKFSERGYSVALFEANAKDYGVPQHRERVFFVAVRSDIKGKPSFPKPTHGGLVGDLFRQLKPHRTFGDACSDLPFLESGECSTDTLHAAVSHPKHNIEWLWNVPEGSSAHDNSDPNLRPPSGYNTTYKRQVWSEPGATVQTTFGMISGCRNVHPIATRSLTVREAARLQSFPDSFKFEAKLGTVRTGIGNSVPPLLAFQIATHIASQII